jgi:hypothetical protein
MYGLEIFSTSSTKLFSWPLQISTLSANHSGLVSAVTPSRRIPACFKPDEFWGIFVCSCGYSWLFSPLF